MQSQHDSDILEELTVDRFEELLDQPFLLRHPSLHQMEVRLIEVRRVSEQAGPSGRIPFSLLFAGPDLAEPFQAQFELEHASLGAQSIFLVPIGRDQRGLLLEAVFT